MRKALAIIGVVLLAFAIAGCDNVLHNISANQITEVQVINLPEDGTYNIPGAWTDGGEEAWDPEHFPVDSEDGEVVFDFVEEYGEAIEVGMDEDGFKVILGADWNNVPVDGGLADTGLNNAHIYDADGMEMDGGEWKIIWDAEKGTTDDPSAALSAEPVEE